MTEEQFENNLIEALTHGELTLPDDRPFDAPNERSRVYRTRLWKYESQIKTTQQLWDNFKRILEDHNQDRLDQPLSANEFNQIKREISNLATPFKAGQFLYGSNGVSQIEIDMDDGTHQFLTVFDQSEVGAGSTVYQVVNQIRRDPVLPGKQHRRFDVTLLINGLPIVQIELKKEFHAADEALNQMHQYIVENQYSDIFSTVQVLVAMTPTTCKYMANTTAEAFNKAFSFEWKREDNTSVHDWKEFADCVLSIPAAHNLSTSYMILDGTPGKEAIKVMRPYQIRATERVLQVIKHLERVEGNKLGYIWHTTGAGKTITSFKTAFLASRMPYVDKVVFAVDRKSLTRQTLDKYRAYDPESEGTDYASIANTGNTTELKNKLNAKGRKIIVTSVQKLQRLVSRKNFKAPEQNIIFIVDEAHRSTGSEIFENIQKKFKRGYWLGYTGTPVFGEHKDFPNTAQIFGKCLDAYTIREGIADRNVLGFKVDFKTTIPEKEVKEYQLPAFYKRLHPDWNEQQIQEKIDNMTEEDFDDLQAPTFYDNNQKHVEAVVDEILKYWEVRSFARKYNAILTTHIGGGGKSSPMAMMYFDEFVKRNSQMEADGIEPLKIAVTFSLDTSNKNGMADNNDGLSRAIQYYNQEFGTSFSDDSVDEYKDDVECRLNHTSADGKYLDLCIVVDQLLTGFDAPSLNTLYVDRTLKGRTLIQAYSRTNRLAGEQKDFGHIINYRWPKQNEKEMNKALAIYSNRSAKDDDPEEWKRHNVKDDIVLADFNTVLSEARSTVSELRALTNDFKEVSNSESELERTLELLREYNKQLNVLTQFTPDEVNIDFEHLDPTNLEQLIPELGLTPKEADSLRGPITQITKEKTAKNKGVLPSDIDLFVVHIKDVTVNYDYLTDLLRDLMIYVHDGVEDKIKDTSSKIHAFAEDLDDRKYAKEIRTAVEAIEKKMYPNYESGLVYPYDNLKDVDVVEQASKVAHMEQMLEFIRKWGLQNLVSPEFLWELVNHHKFGEKDLKETEVNRIRKEAAAKYMDYSNDPEVRKLTKIKFRIQFYISLYDLADECVSN